MGHYTVHSTIDSCLTQCIVVDFSFLSSLYATERKKNKWWKTANKLRYSDFLLVSFHPLLHFLLFIRVRSQWQQVQQGSADIPLPWHIFQLILGYPKAFSGQSYITSIFWGSPTSWTLPEILQSEASRRHPDKMLEPPQLYSKLSPDEL